MEGTDFALLAAWRAGDATAGSQLARRHFRAVHRFFALKVAEAADDLVQRTFLACVEQRDRLPNGGSFKAYLFGIARNLLWSHLRRGARTAPQEGTPRSLEDFGTTMSQFIELREAQRSLVTALRRLPVDSQITLELFYWEQLRITEIAAVLGVAPGTVKSRLARARDLLRTHITEPCDASELDDSVRTELDQWLRGLRDSDDRPE